jgi:uncharacterized protein (TIGR02679 family)
VERTGSLDGSVSLAGPDDAERHLVTGITGSYRATGARAVRVALFDLDDDLRDRCGMGLLAVLARLNGPVRNRPAERAEEGRAKAATRREAAARAGRHAGEAWFHGWLDAIAADGTLTRLVRRGDADLPGWAAEVLRRLPSDSMPLPVLAELATGDTKALSGTPLAGLVLRAWAGREGRPAPGSRAEQRAAWESAGVIVDDLASQVLVLHVRGRESHVVASWLGDAADFGIPFRLTLQQLMADPLTVAGGNVYVCENPAVLRAAASELAGSGAPLICTEGQPSAACHRLLASARGRIHWRGDFDWFGLRTTAMAIEKYDAVPWRMSIRDYTAGLDEGLTETEPLKGPAADSPWEPALATEMVRRGRSVMEERLIHTLLADLAG